MFCANFRILWVVMLTGHATVSCAAAASEFPRPYPAGQVGARLTPKPGAAPQFHGTATFGALQGCEVLFRVPVSGERPIAYRAEGLPDGVAFDPERGIFRGTPAQAGTWQVRVTARNSAGEASKTYTLKSGTEKLFAPPMGWNSWYVFSEAVSAKGIAAVARWMDEKGLADFGWSFVNIDDCWQGDRGGKALAIQPNARFEDMKGLCAEIHARGLKAGIYSTPWISTYAGFIGGSCPEASGDSTALAIAPDKRGQATQYFGTWPGLHQLKLDRTGEHWFFDRDARQWAEWGFDFVKVDWKPNDVATTRRVLADLDGSGRSIILSLSNEAPRENMAELKQLANLTRTTGDIRDTWESVAGIGFHQDSWQKYLGPGHFPDPDMLQVGRVATAGQFNTQSRPSKLTPDEQYSQVTLWALLKAPLIISCDLERIDDFTLGLLCNHEIVDLNQNSSLDPAEVVYRDGGLVVWRKDAVYAFFNTGNQRATFRIPLAKLGKQAQGAREIKDLWSHADFRLGDGTQDLELEIHPHGVRLLKLSRQDP